MSRLRVYLDIDGTILFDALDQETPEGLDFQLVCDGLVELLEFVVANCEPYWLSYRARLGSAAALEERLFPHLPEIARSIPPAYWDQFKHEAIDPTLPFVWFEDGLEAQDQAWLERHNRQDAFVRVDRANRDNPRLMLEALRVRLQLTPQGPDTEDSRSKSLQEALNVVRRVLSGKAMKPPNAGSLRQLMDMDEAAELPNGAYSFDDQLWLLLAERITEVEQAKTYPEPVWVYFASRYLEWEVGNGGFPQAAYNIPEWLPLASKAYRQLGLSAAADLIDRANNLVLGGESRFGRFTARTIGRLFLQFRESRLAELDSELDSVGWWAEEVRLAYVRRNRDSFRSVT